MDLHRWLTQKRKTKIRSIGHTFPTSTTTYLDASGLEETHTIMRADLVAMYVVLDK
jgi:hypothetical protein